MGCNIHELNLKISNLEVLAVSNAGLSSAILDILKSKNIVSDKELEEHLKKLKTDLIMASTNYRNSSIH